MNYQNNIYYDIFNKFLYFFGILRMNLYVYLNFVFDLEGLINLELEMVVNK